jgi:hypothetical protein
MSNSVGFDAAFVRPLTSIIGSRVGGGRYSISLESRAARSQYNTINSANRNAYSIEPGEFQLTLGKTHQWGLRSGTNVVLLSHEVSLSSRPWPYHAASCSLTPLLLVP